MWQLRMKTAVTLVISGCRTIKHSSGGILMEALVADSGDPTL